MELSELVAERWRQAWAELPAPCREAYFHPDYVSVCGRWERARARCFGLRDGGRWMIYPALAHPITGGDRWDLQTAYGYGGPMFVGEWSAEQRVAALVRLGERLREEGAVAEFVRCHTEWSDLEALRQAGYRVFQVRTNVECDLVGDDLSQGWASAARRNLRKARSLGLRWRMGEGARDWAAFEQLYAATAQRLEMAAGYRFDSAYFSGLARVEGVRLVLVESGSIAVAGAVVFIGGVLAHYHLGASDFAHQQSRPNDLLYLAMASAAREARCRRIVWGGGLSNDPADSLFRFKTHFGQLRRPVFAAGRVIDPEAYEGLCQQWEAEHPQARSGLFLKYRT